jgi:hypothetical protein
MRIPLWTADVAEPIDIFVLNDVADKLRTALANSVEGVVPVRRPAHSPSIVARPSSSRPRSEKNSTAASRDSTSDG